MPEFIAIVKELRLAGATTSLPYTMPAISRGVGTFVIEADLDEKDRLDLTTRFSLHIERSSDGIVWEPCGGYTYEGNTQHDRNGVLSPNPRYGYDANILSGYKVRIVVDSAKPLSIGQRVFHPAATIRPEGLESDPHHSLAFVQQIPAVGLPTFAGPTVSINCPAFTSGVTANNLVIAAGSYYCEASQTSPTLADSKSNSGWAVDQFKATGYITAWVGSVKAVTGGTGFIVTASRAVSTYWSMGCAEFSGQDLTTRYAGGSTNSGSGTAASTGNTSPTPSGNAVYITSIAMLTGGAVTEAGWTVLWQDDSGGMSDERWIASGALGQSWTLAISQVWCAVVAAYNEAAVAGGLSIPVAIHHYRQQGVC